MPLETGLHLIVDAGQGFFDASDSSPAYSCTSNDPAVTVTSYCFALAAGPGQAIVTVRNSGHQGGLLVRVDSATHLSFGAEDVTAYDLALSDRHTVWSTSYAAGGSGAVLYRTDITTRTATKITGGAALTPGSVAVDRVNGIVYFTAFNVGGWDSTQVLMFTTAGTLVDTLATLLGTNYASIYVPGSGLYVGAGSRVVRIDPATGAILADHDLGSGTVLRLAAHAGTNRLFAVAFSGSGPSRVAPLYEMTLDSLAVLKTRASADAHGIAVSGDGGTIFYASEWESRLTRCVVGTDACTFTVTDGHPAGVTLSDDGTKVFVMGDYMVTTYNAGTLTPLDHQVIQGLPRFGVATDSGPAMVFTHDRGVDLLKRDPP